MNTDPVNAEQAVVAMAAAIAGTAERLHGIRSRSDGTRIAAEVLRLNDAVRAGAVGRFSSASHPADFPALLRANADSFGSGGTR